MLRRRCQVGAGKLSFCKELALISRVGLDFESWSVCTSGVGTVIEISEMECITSSLPV